MNNAKLELRIANNTDIAGLEQLEQKAFASDRFTAKQIEYLLTEARSTIFILEQNREIAGSAYMLWRRPNRIGRLYNLAVNPKWQGQGIGKLLLQECELEAVRRRCERIALEVRMDNEKAIAFYHKAHFAVIKKLPAYYDDGTAGYKMEKPLTRKVPGSIKRNMAYIHQSLDFTCGAACLMMALKHFHKKIQFSRTLELNLWKEATQIFLTSGIGGTDPFGLALAAHRRGHEARVILSREQTPFFSSVRIPDKRQVLKIMHNDYRQKAINAGISEAYIDFTIEDIISAIYRKMVPIVLISTYRISGDQVPHWVVVTGFDAEHIYFHDPDLESFQEMHRSPRNVRIKQVEFDRMRKYGKDLYKCAILIGNTDHPATINIDGSDKSTHTR